MPIKPEDVDPSKLPAAMRGYDRAATEELLKRVAWDYRQALRVEENWVQERKGLRQQITELETRLESQQTEFTRALAERLTSRDHATSARTSELEAEVQRLERLVRRHQARGDLIEALYQSAKRTAHELRESARQDAEATLKSARKRADQIEKDARVDARHASAEIGRLQQLEADLRDRLRDTLEAVIGEPAAEEHEPSP